jgi:hypothetical protein
MRTLITKPSNCHDLFIGPRLCRRVAEFDHMFQAKETLIWRID